MKKKITLGLTGGIGTGKSYIARFFFQQGIPVYNADEQAKKFYKEPEVINDIEKKIGKKITINGIVDFSLLKEIFFSNEAKRRAVEEVIHPLVIKDFLVWRETEESEVVIMESAIIFEADLEFLFDYIIAVDVAEELRIKRLLERNPSWSKEDINKRMAIQISQEEKCDLANFTIYNTNDEDIIYQIKEILLKI